jgi:hypothetical protein
LSIGFVADGKSEIIVLVFTFPDQVPFTTVAAFVPVTVPFELNLKT